MKISFVMAVALVLLVTSVSFGQMANSQAFGSGYGNGTALLGGPGVADSTNINTVGQYQQNQDMAGINRSVQAQNGGIVQAAGVGGIGNFVVGQKAHMGGAQGQFHNGNPFSLGTNAQTGGIGLGQAVIAGPGPIAGIAFGLQQAYLNQFQIIATPFGTNVNTAPVTASAFNTAGN